MRLAVVIISYNVKALLRGCLASVLASAARTAERLAVDVVVVDNASQDGSAAMVAAEFPAVHLLASGRNRGFTGGNNLALQALGFPCCAGSDAPPRLAVPDPDFVLFLNPDAEPAGEALYTLAAYLDTHPEAGACGAQLRYGDGSFQHGAFHFPSLAQVALDFFPLTGLPGAWRLHNSRWNGRYSRAQWAGSGPFTVDFVLGAAMMVRAAAISQSGGFDTGYWMYCEEMDWCLRLRTLGWLVAAVPQAVVVHHEAQSSRQRRWSSFERMWRSRFRFYSLHQASYPVGYLAAVRGLVRLGLAGRRRAAEAAFAAGATTGSRVAEELAAYRAIAKL